MVQVMMLVRGLNVRGGEVANGLATIGVEDEAEGVGKKFVCRLTSFVIDMVGDVLGVAAKHRPLMKVSLMV